MLSGSLKPKVAGLPVLRRKTFSPLSIIFKDSKYKGPRMSEWTSFKVVDLTMGSIFYLL